MSPAYIAADQYRRRQSWLQHQVDGGAMHADEAEAKLRPWLAIAAMAGADLPELFEEHTQLFPWEGAGQTVQHRIPAQDITPRAEALEALAQARDSAIEALSASGFPGDPAKARRAAQTAQDLATLAIQCGARPARLSITIDQQQERQAA